MAVIVRDDRAGGRANYVDASEDHGAVACSCRTKEPYTSDCDSHRFISGKGGLSVRSWPRHRDIAAVSGYGKLAGVSDITCRKVQFNKLMPQNDPATLRAMVNGDVKADLLNNTTFTQFRAPAMRVWRPDVRSYRPALRLQRL
ncbi:hypothetical protein [Teichococcus oryzae]|uniref:Uncharacterized protein n=1 Tax=Teichococcus oryzae TaxID=1608942 RepID=A0A5B2TBH9_9PROT|nr:hypothetical protein [Pseudoroseomonas oryzae]KAA2211198.1 hypothetical protein F0Q34_21380 [Pseudoroseomonas oryzae]